MKIIDQLRAKFPENGPWWYSHARRRWVGKDWSVDRRSPFGQFEDEDVYGGYYRTDTNERLFIGIEFSEISDSI